MMLSPNTLFCVYTRLNIFTHTDILALVLVSESFYLSGSYFI